MALQIEKTKQKQKDVCMNTDAWNPNPYVGVA